MREIRVVSGRDEPGGGRGPMSLSHEGDDAGCCELGRGDIDMYQIVNRSANSQVLLSKSSHFRITNSWDRYPVSSNES